jgi:hypothetical protein
MSDIDRVFARFVTPGAAPTSRRQSVTVAGRGARSSRVVEVVHLGHASGTAEDAPARHASDVGGAAWGAEVTGKGAPQAPAPAPAGLETAAPSSPQPVVHMMPAWEPRPLEVETTTVAEAADPTPSVAVKVTRRPRSEAASRRVADPYDTSDDGANCIRCGYLVEPAREKRGLMTCAGCG